LNVCSPPNVGLIFRQSEYAKTKGEHCLHFGVLLSLFSQSNYLFYLCLFYQEWKDTAMPHQANPLNNGVFLGAKYLNKMLAQLATLCGFKDPHKNTAHSKRKHAITSLVSATEGIGHQNIKTAARHKSDDAHDQCQGS
jgi:hypothetical protein